jgi:hypothetical protein
MTFQKLEALVEDTLIFFGGVAGLWWFWFWRVATVTAAPQSGYLFDHRPIERGLFCWQPMPAMPTTQTNLG